jgi:hypothetical protein
MWGFFYAFRKFFLTFFGRCDIIYGSEENFMAKIIEFPDKISGSQRVRNELARMANQLESCYRAMDEAVQALGEMEVQIKNLEDEYNYKLLELVENVGIQNVTADEFQYATNIGVGAGSRQYTMTLEDGKTFTFTFETEEDNE